AAPGRLILREPLLARGTLEEDVGGHRRAKLVIDAAGLEDELNVDERDLVVLDDVDRQAVGELELLKLREVHRARILGRRRVGVDALGNLLLGRWWRRFVGGLDLVLVDDASGGTGDGAAKGQAGQQRINTWSGHVFDSSWGGQKIRSVWGLSRLGASHSFSGPTS